MRIPLSVLLLLASASSASAQDTRPQDPEPPFPYVETDLAYESASDGTRLTGTLALPEGEGPFPAALLISGAGPQDRNYSAFGHRFFLVLSDHLARRGIAVLRMDDRGAGGSEGDASQATLKAVIGDVEAGVSLLRDHAGIREDAVGLIAHSEGGRVAPQAAFDGVDIGFLVLLAPPAVSAAELGRAQADAMSAVSDDPLIEVQATLIGRIRAALADEPNNSRALVAIRTDADEWIDSLPPEQSGILSVLWAREEFQAQVDQLVQALGTPWNRELYEIEPAPVLASLDVPVLAVYGERDVQAPPGRNVPVLEDLWSDHPDATILLLPGLNHFFQHAETGLPAEIGTIEETFAEEAMDAVADWILERFGVG